MPGINSGRPPSARETAAGLTGASAHARAHHEGWTHGRASLSRPQRGLRARAVRALSARPRVGGRGVAHILRLRLPRGPRGAGRGGSTGRAGSGRRSVAGAGQAVLRARAGAHHPRARAHRRAAGPAGRRPPAGPGAGHHGLRSDRGGSRAASAADHLRPRPALVQRPGRDPAAAPRLHGHGGIRIPAPARSGRARLDSRGHRERHLRPAAPGGAPARAAGPAVAGGGLRALSAPRLLRTEALLHRGDRHPGPHSGRDHRRRGRHRRQRRADRHGAPRAAERADPRAGQAVRDDAGRLQGRSAEGRAGRRPELRRAVRRREVPHGVDGRAGGERPDGARPPLPEPQSPGVRRPRRGGDDARRAGRDVGPWRAPAGPLARGGRAHPRRRGVPGTGRGPRDHQHAVPDRLHRRRHHPHHRQQPGRLYHRPARGPLHPLLQRPGQGLRGPRGARQRGRRGGVRGGGAAGARVPQAVGQGLPHRPGRLPALGAQRGRRAALHAAGDVRRDQGPPHRPRGPGKAPGKRGGDDAARRRMPPTSG